MASQQIVQSVVSQFRNYEKAVYDWLLTAPVNSDGSQVPVVIATPDRAFAAMNTLLKAKGLVRGDTSPKSIPLPFISVTSGALTFDGSRYRGPVSQQLGRTSDNSSGFTSKFPLPYNIGYRVEFWAKNQEVMNVFKLWTSISFAQGYESFIHADLSDIWPAWKDKLIPIQNEGMRFVGDYEPEEGHRVIRMVLDFTLKGWIVPPVASSKTILSIITKIYLAKTYAELGSVDGTTVDESNLYEMVSQQLTLPSGSVELSPISTPSSSPSEDVTGPTSWPPTSTSSTSTGSVADGIYGDITVSGSSWLINPGVIGTAELGLDITSFGKTLLTLSDAAAERAYLGLGSAAIENSASFEPAGSTDIHALLTSGTHGISSFASTLLDDLDAAAFRTTLGLGTAATQDISAFDASGSVATHAALTSGVHGISSFASTLLDDLDAAAFRATLGLGTSATQDSSSFEASGSVATHAALTSGIHGISSFAATFLDDADALEARSTLGLGTAATQASSAFESSGSIAAHAALISGVHGISSFASTLLDDVDASSFRTTLGLGSAATQDSSSFEASGSVSTHAALTSGVHGISSFAATLLDDADAGTVRTTIGAAATSHNHAASEITSGTLDRARLGSGTTGSTLKFLREDSSWQIPSHADISGLDQDDHMQYILEDGSRTFSGAPSSSVAASTSTQLMRKGEHDSDISGRQPLDSELTALAGLVSAADKLPYFTGSGTAALTDLSAFGRTLIDDVDASTARTTLGLGTLATQSGTFSGTSSGTNTGDQTISFSGDLSGSGTGAITATIVSSAVTNAKMANMAASTIKGRAIGAGTGAPTDLNTAQIAALALADGTVCPISHTHLATDILIDGTLYTGGLAGLTGDEDLKNLLSAIDATPPWGAGSSFTITETEIDFGSAPVVSATLTVTAAGVGSTDKILVWPSGNAATGQTSDTWEADGIMFSAKAGTGQFSLYCVAYPGPISGKRKIFYSKA